MHPDLRRIGADAERAAGDLTDIATGLSETQLAWSPAPGAWSLEQIFDHIALASARYTTRLGPVIGAATRGAAQAPAYRPRLLGRRLIAAERDTSRRRTAPAAFAPTNPPPPDALDRAVRALAHLAGLVVAADGLDVNRIRVASARLPFVRLSVGDELTLAVAHATRHVAQARRVREHPAFPI
jgi:hypothetical protein